MRYYNITTATEYDSLKSSLNLGITTVIKGYDENQQLLMLVSLPTNLDKGIYLLGWGSYLIRKLKIWLQSKSIMITIKNTKLYAYNQVVFEYKELTSLEVGVNELIIYSKELNKLGIAKFELNAVLETSFANYLARKEMPNVIIR